jgi:MoaA/NifB/PqqE/SkfB family radical SAM enzyme
MTATGDRATGSRRFCNAPFYGFEIIPSGDVQLCCGDWLPHPVGNIFKSSAREIWNSPLAQAIRNSVLEDTFNYCTRCPFLPNSPSLLPETLPPTNLDSIPSLRLGYDRTCNLACPSCRSSIALEDRKQVELVHEAMIGSGALDMAKQVHMSGRGDPIASPTFFKFMQDLPVLAPHLQIALITNGQLLDQHHLDLLGSSANKIEEINISVDASTPETYAKNRGGSWTKLWNNVQLINRAIRKPGFQFHMSFVLQSNNFRELIPFTQIAFENQADEIFVWYRRNWTMLPSIEHRLAAVPTPDRPDYAEFAKIMTDPRLTEDPRIHLPAFPPTVAP